jgi:acyl carrier protein
VSFFDSFKRSPKEPAEIAAAGQGKAEIEQTTAVPVGREVIIVALRGHLETVWRATGKSLTQADLDENADLYEKGYVDSLSAAQFLLLSEKQFGVRLPDWLLGGRAKSLTELSDYIADELSRRR